MSNLIQPSVLLLLLLLPPCFTNSVCRQLQPAHHRATQQPLDVQLHPTIVLLLLPPP
jgi:hypothetical protein